MNISILMVTGETKIEGGKAVFQLLMLIMVGSCILTSRAVVNQEKTSFTVTQMYKELLPPLPEP